MEIIINDNISYTPQDNDFEIISVDGDIALVRLNGENHKIRLIVQDPKNKSFVFEINKKNYQIKIKEDIDVLIEQLNKNTKSAIKVNDLKAPMPGQVKSILAHQGANVSKGDPLLIIEAMKMENSIISPTDGVIDTIKVKEGEAIDKNQILLTFVQ